MLPSAVMKDALRGRWRLTSPASSTHEGARDGDVHVESEGVMPKYTYKLFLRSRMQVRELEIISWPERISEALIV